MVGLSMIPLIASFVLAAATPAASSPGYARFCSGAQTETETQLKKINDDQRKRFPVQQSDAFIVEAATRAIRAANLKSMSDLTSLSIAVRYYGVVTGRGPFAPDEAILFRTEGDKGPTYAVVTFDNSGKAKAVRAASKTEVEQILTFGRVMASYMLFNDLTSSDAIIPRRGCLMAFREQFYALPEVLPEVSAAIRTKSAQDPALLDRVQKSLDRYIATAQASDGAAAAIARRTLQSIGPSPTISILYRDRDRILGTTAEYDVIRLDGKKRAYAMFDVDKNNKSTLGPMPICLVGDMSCGAFYSWP
jgi:hypothetical protein